MKERIMNNQKRHHELLQDYFRVCETIRVAEIERDNLRLEIVSVAGAMNFVDQARADMRVEPKAGGDD